MQKLIDGIRSFQTHTFPSQKEMFQQLAKGQQPTALFITCSDSRIDPNLVTQTDPGELFVLRNAGNIVPVHGTTAGGEAATIEYAVSVLQIKNIIICGHSQCGAMSGLLNPEALESLPAVRSCLKHAEATRQIIQTKYEHLQDPQARLMAAVEQNVLVQLQNLRTHPSVATALERDDLKLHGWVYRFETGQVFAWDPSADQFRELE